jgi:hypothetical protein
VIRRTFVSLGLVAGLLTAVAAAAGALPAGSSPARATASSESFAGDWLNTNSATNAQTRALIKVNGSNFEIYGYGKCSPTDCDWASYPGVGGPRTPPTSDASDGVMVITWPFGFKTTTQTLTLVSEGSLRIDTHDAYSGGGTNDYTEYFYNSTPWRLKVSKTGAGSGSTSVSPSGLNCGSGCWAYASGASVGVSASPAEGAKFDGWSGACSGTGGCNVSMTTHRSVTATFSALAVKLTVTKSGNGTVTSAPGGITCGATCAADFSWGTPVTLTAAAASGSSLLAWGGACSGAAPTCSVTLKTPTSVSATFGAFSVTKAAFDVAWKQSRSQGGVVLAGSTSQDASLLVTLKPGSEESKAVLIRRKTVKAGRFNVSLPVPDRLRPGKYVLIVEPTIQGIALPAQKKNLQLVPPKEGVVAVAYIANGPGGKPLKQVPKGTKKLYAYFKFATGGMSKLPLTVEWYGPKGTLIGATKKPRKPVVETLIAYKPGLSKGTWGCILRAGGIAVEDVFVRVA